MPPITPFPQQVLVTPQAPSNVSNADGQGIPWLGGKQGDGLISQLHGNYFSQAYRGNVFCADAGQAGLLMPVYSGTTLAFSIWNPASSGKLVVPIKLYLGWHDTTGAPGDIFYCYTANCGDGIATGGVVSAFTAITGQPQNCYLGAGNVSKTKVGSAATVAAAPTILRNSGISQLTTTGTAATVGVWQIYEDFDGSIIIPPGVLFTLMGSQALLSKFNTSIVWEEVPV